MNPFDICKADGRVVRFCGRGEDRAEADIVRAFMLRCERLVEAVRGFSNQNNASGFAPRDFDRIVILSDMHAFYWDPAGDFRVIIHDERRGRSRGDFVQPRRVTSKYVERFVFSA